MPRTSTSSPALTKLASALKHLEDFLSTESFSPLDTKGFTMMFQVSNTLPTVLRRMKVLIPNPEKRGEYKLGSRIQSLRPGTVLKYVNEYQKETRQSRQLPKRKTAPRVVKPVPQASSLETYLVALKEQMRKEVMEEIMNALKK